MIICLPIDGAAFHPDFAEKKVNTLPFCCSMTFRRFTEIHIKHQPIYFILAAGL
ncbi:hypothetical protein D3C78_1752040 [compost metagenome]